MRQAMMKVRVARSGRMVPGRGRLGFVLNLLAIAVVAMVVMVAAPPAGATGLREISDRVEPPAPLEPPVREHVDPDVPPVPTFRIAVITGDTAQSPLRRGAISAAGHQVEIVDNALDPENALDLQINLVENAIVAKVDGIILDPLHPEGLAPYVERARAAGIAVVTVNNPVATPLVNAHISTDHSDSGIAVVDRLLNLVGSDVVVGILGGASPEDHLRKRREGFLLRLRERYPRIRVVEPAPGEGSPDDEMMKITRATRTTLDLIAANPEVRGILTVDGGTTVGAARGVARAGLSGEVAVVGFDPGPEGLSLLRAGAVQGFLVEDYHGIGYTALVRMVEILRGGLVPPTVVVPYRFMTSEADAGGRYSR
jgi:ribose transport system substrate-binding protein